MDVCLTSPYGFHDITIVEKQEKTSWILYKIHGCL